MAGRCRRCINLIAGARSPPSTRYRDKAHLTIVTTIRTEFVPRLEELFAGAEVRLWHAPLSAISSLAEIIEQPAERYGIQLGPGLSAQIVNDVHSANALPLPLLAYTLKELYERGSRDRTLTIDGYRKIGGVA